MLEAWIIAGVILAPNGWDANWFKTGYEYSTLEACEAGRQLYPQMRRYNDERR